MSSSSSPWQSSSVVVPARLSFLGIYNPTLGPTDETFPDQLVFWYSRATDEARKTARQDGAGGDALREEQNEKLRQIGLAQGIIDFARTFSDGRPVDSVDTEKSRIVMQELEPGWWVLASVDLTRLPTANQAPSKSSSKKSSSTTDKPATVEYSSREVSPAPLLIQQILQAHHIFQLHNGPSITELYIRQPRPKFCNLLARFWIRFARSWDVLLHGNPSADLFSGLKLSGGGELGMGVGEETWGSGERDVLEDLTRRTEGLVDVIVSRFGDSPSSDSENSHDRDEVPWMGSGNLPQAHDGVVFAGSQILSRPSLRNLSIWMRQIYTYGEHAYGARDHPSRERRRGRRRPPPAREPDPIKPLARASEDVDAKDWHPKTESNEVRTEGTRSSVETAKRANIKDRTTSSTSGPKIPAPIAVAIEQALDKATRQVESDADHGAAEASDSGTTMGIPDQYMKYLTLGLSTLAKPAPSKRPHMRRLSTSSSNTIKATTRLKQTDHSGPSSKDDAVALAQVEPIPDGEPRQAKMVRQRSLENKGHFVVGLVGDLDDVKSEGDPSESSTGSGEDDDAARILVRTVYLELTPEHVKSEYRRAKLGDSTIMEGLDALDTVEFLPPQFGNDATMNFRRLRVVVYARRPFVYCFLFENRTSSLQMSGLYKSLHRNLIAIHKPMVSSTSPARLIERINASRAAVPGHLLDPKSLKQTSLDESAPIYDLIYDPQRLTILTSIPNIPEPGTPAAEGLSMTSRGGSGNTKSTLTTAWTRIEALNVHSQVLNTLLSTSSQPSSSTATPSGLIRHDLERTSKTSRGWWVVWLRLPPSDEPSAKAPASHNRNAKPNLSSNNNDGTSFQISFATSNSTLPGPPSTTSPSQRGPPPSNDRIAVLVRNGNNLPAPTNTSESNLYSSSPSNTPLTAAQAQMQSSQQQQQQQQDGLSRAAASMWSALSLRPYSSTPPDNGAKGTGWTSLSAMTGGGGGSNSPAGSTAAGIGAGTAAAGALGGGIGVDARGWVEGVLGGLNR